MFKKIIVLAAIFIFFAAEIKAQTGFESKTGLGIGPVLGWQKAKDADNGRIMFGAALRLRLTQALGAEASINYKQDKYANDAITAKSWPIMISGLFYPIPMIYGIIGAGWYNTTFDYSNNVVNSISLLGLKLGDQTVQRFGWHFGAGLEIDTGSSMKLFGDVRYIFLQDKFDNAAIQAIKSVNSLNSNFYVINVGLLFGF
jgi:opacity protein-like surface antigen